MKTILAILLFIAASVCSGQVVNPSTGGSPGGSAGGDLSGTYPNPTVAKLNAASVPVSASVLGSNSSSQLIANPTGSCSVFARQTTPVAVTGTTSETAMWTVSLPANTLAAGNFLRLTSAMFGTNGNAGTANMLVRYGATATGGTAVGSTSAGSSSNSWFNFNSTVNVQSTSAQAWQTFVTKANAVTSVNTTTAISTTTGTQVISVNVVPNTSGDTNTLELGILEICK